MESEPGTQRLRLTCDDVDHDVAVQSIDEQKEEEKNSNNTRRK